MTKRKDFLGGPKRRLPRRRGDKAEAVKMPVGPITRGYEDGPFPALPVNAPPTELLELIRYRTKLSLTVEQWAEIERLRAYVGYDAPELDAKLRMKQHLCTAGPSTATPTRKARPKATRVLLDDPDDLGDW